MRPQAELIKGADKALRVAEKVLEHYLRNPDLRDVMERMLADENITKEQLCHTAFAQGVISTLDAIQEGRLVPMSNN